MYKVVTGCMRMFHAVKSLLEHSIFLSKQASEESRDDRPQRAEGEVALQRRLFVSTGVSGGVVAEG